MMTSYSCSAKPDVPTIVNQLEQNKSDFAAISAIAGQHLEAAQLPAPACALLHEVDREMQETGYPPEDTLAEAVKVGADGHRAIRHAQRLAAQRSAAGERGRL